MLLISRRWATFQAQPSVHISYADVPWPPSAAALLRWLAAAAPQEGLDQRRNLQRCRQQMSRNAGNIPSGAGSDAAARDLSRAAFLQASRRWHPDKFEAKFGSRIVAADRAAVMAAVHALMQGINQAAAAQQSVD